VESPSKQTIHLLLLFLLPYLFGVVRYCLAWWCWPLCGVGFFFYSRIPACRWLAEICLEALVGHRAAARGCLASIPIIVCSAFVKLANLMFPSFLGTIATKARQGGAVALDMISADNLIHVRCHLGRILGHLGGAH
jgi:hypothetical protein